MGLSQRLVERFQSPLFFEQNIDHISDTLKTVEENKNFFTINYEIPGSNGYIILKGYFEGEGELQKIASLKYSTNIHGVSLAFVDVLVEFCHQQTKQGLKRLKFREIESFLRDDNSLPVFSSEDNLSFYRYFEIVNQLIHLFPSSSSMKMISPSLENYIPHQIDLFNPKKLGPFRSLTFDLQKEIIEDILDYYIRLHLRNDGGDVQYVCLMDYLIVLKFLGNCGICGFSMTSTMDFIKNVLKTELDDTTLEVISDS